MNDVRHNNNEDQPLPLVWDDMGKGYLEVIPSSPLAVNIDDMRVITVPSLKFHDFDALPVKMKLYNNGRTVTLNGNWSSDKRPSISGSSLVETYCFSHLHFHWTENDNFGSEHTINGKGHAMEMHLVFFKRSCETIFEAESQQNGYVTLAYVFDITSNGQHLGIDSITLHLNKIQECRKTVRIPGIPLGQLVGNRAGEYFTYLGNTNKLGGKVCVSRWIVFTEARGITSEQLKQLRCTMDDRGHLIRRNCRATNVAPTGNAALYLVQPTASSNPEGAANKRTQNETGPESAVEEQTQNETGPESAADKRIQNETGPESSADKRIQNETGPESAVDERIQNETGPESAVNERTQNETGPEVIAADAFPSGSAGLGHLGSNLPPSVSTTSVRSVQLLKMNKTHVLRCEFVKKRMTHSRSVVVNGSAAAAVQPKINVESTVNVTANSQVWTVVKPPWK